MEFLRNIIQMGKLWITFASSDLDLQAKVTNTSFVESYPLPTYYLSLKFFELKLRPAAWSKLCVLNIAIFWPLWTSAHYAFENGIYFTIAMDIIITCKWIKLQFDTNFVKIKYILTELLRTFDFSLLTPGDLDLESRSAKSSAGLSLSIMCWNVKKIMYGMWSV